MRLRRGPVVLLALLVLAVVLVLSWTVLAPHPAGEVAPPETPRVDEVTPSRRVHRPQPAPEEVDPAADVEEPPATDREDVARDVLVTVLDAVTGEPLADARVVVDEPGRATRELRTDARGAASFEPAAGDGGEAAAWAPGHVRGFWFWSGDPPEEISLRLARGERLVGRVVDPDGRPLADVHLDLDEGGTLDGMSSGSSGPLLGSADTDDSGAFAVDGVPAGELVTLLVRHRGFAAYERTLRVPAGGGDGPLVVRLRPGGSVAGVVRDDALAPVAGATVLVAASDSEHLLDDPDANVVAMGASQSSALAARTDAEVRYRIDGLELDAPYVVVATRPGTGRSERVRDVVARNGAPVATVDLRLRPPLTVVLRVVDADGAPVEGALVLRVSGRVENVPEESPGTFRIGGLDPGELVCDVSASGFVQRRVTESFDASGELPVRLDRGLSISGIAVDDLGEPLPDASIRCMRPLGREYRDLPRSLADGRTDADGRFEVGGLLPGTHQVLCWAEGRDVGRLEPVEAGARDVRVVAMREARVVIELRLPPGATPPPSLAHQYVRDGGGSGNGTDWPEDGRLEVAVPPSPLTFVVLVEGYADLVFDVDAGPGETRHLGVVTLGAGLTATGRVTDPGGRAVPGAEVRAAPAWAFDGRVAQTGDDGRFRMPLLADAPHEVVVTAPGFLEERATRDPSSDAVWDVTLSRGALVRGSVRDTAGVGVSAGAVWLVALDGDDADDRTDLGYPDNAGRYGVRVRPGRYRAEYRPDDGPARVLDELQLDEGSTVTLDVTTGQ